MLDGTEEGDGVLRATKLRLYPTTEQTRQLRGCMWVVPQERVHDGPLFRGWRDVLPALPARAEDLESGDGYYWGAVRVRIARADEPRVSCSQPYRLHCGRPYRPAPRVTAGFAD